MLHRLGVAEQKGARRRNWLTRGSDLFFAVQHAAVCQEISPGRRVESEDLDFGPYGEFLGGGARHCGGVADIASVYPPFGGGLRP